jgi:hypothetical protein
MGLRHFLKENMYVHMYVGGYFDFKQWVLLLMSKMVSTACELKSMHTCIILTSDFNHLLLRGSRLYSVLVYSKHGCGNSNTVY